MVQRGNLCRGGFEVAIVMDDIISDGQTLATARLRRQNAARLIFRVGVPGEQPPDLGVFIAVNHDNTVYKSLERRICQQRHDNDLIGGR